MESPMEYQSDKPKRKKADPLYQDTQDFHAVIADVFAATHPANRPKSVTLLAVWFMACAGASWEYIHAENPVGRLQNALKFSAKPFQLAEERYGADKLKERSWDELKDIITRIADGLHGEDRNGPHDTSVRQVFELAERARFIGLQQDDIVRDALTV